MRRVYRVDPLRMGKKELGTQSRPVTQILLELPKNHPAELVYSNSYNPLFSPFMNTRPELVPEILSMRVGTWHDSSVWKKLSLLSVREIPIMVAEDRVQMTRMWVMSSINTSKGVSRGIRVAVQFRKWTDLALP